MKAFLMYRERDFDLKRTLPSHEQALTQDLELNTLFNAMALGDEFLFEVAKKVFLFSVSDLDTILYRQNILRDCLNNPSIVRDIYAVAAESIEREKKHYFGFLSNYPDTILNRSIEVLQMFVVMLKKLRNIGDEHAGKFQSEGFRAFFAMLNKELNDEYFASIQNHLRQVKFRGGVLMSAELGKGGRGANYILRKPPDRKQSLTHWLFEQLPVQSWIQWFFDLFEKQPAVYTFYIHPRDESGARAVSELRDRGINLVANALAQSLDHILSFFSMLRTELGFYVGCVNLHQQLAKKGEPMSFPLPVAVCERRLSFKGVYDVCLALRLEQRTVGNDVNADSKELVIITGANQGGKSTFLRSVGLSQLMMQCGMFVPAKFFRSNVCYGLFTHYKREEDATMKSGKFDEELSRMSGIVDNVTSNSILLFNESFAATNEREGAEIARQIISALLEKRIKVFFVTHSYECAHRFYDKEMENAIFLRAERQPDGVRTFKLLEGEPLQTSYGQDLYNKIFTSRTDLSRQLSPKLL
jgi:DNA mismatch repair ATPase MutS